MENNEQAKRILFGKDIAKKMGNIPCYGVENGEGVEYKFTHESRPKHNTMDMQNDNQEPEIRELLDIVNGKSESSAEDRKLFENYFLWPKEWFDQIVAYCREQKIDPPQLIEQHKVAYKDV